MTQQINLFNPIFRKQKKYFSSVAMVQALGIICVGVALLATDAAIRTQALTKQAAATNALLELKQQRLTAVKAQFAPRVKSATLAAEIVAAQQEMTMLQNATATVKRGGFGDTRGFSAYFRAFARQSVPGVWLTDLEVASEGDRIGVQGNALQAPLVPQYMSRLAQEPVMKGKEFSTLSISAVAQPQVSVVTTAGTTVAASALPGYLSFSLQSVGAKSATVVAK